MIDSKHLFSESCLGGPITWGFTYFQSLSGILYSACSEVFRRFGVAGGEGVPPSPLGGYLQYVIAENKQGKGKKIKLMIFTEFTMKRYPSPLCGK